MNFEQGIAAIEGITHLLRQNEQNVVLFENQARNLERENTSLKSEIAGLREMVATLSKQNDMLINKNEKLAHERGALKENIRAIMQKHIDMASHAAEGLKALENKPEPMLDKTIKEEEEFKELISAPVINWRQAVDKLVEEERKEALSQYGEGAKIILSPQNDIGEKRLKYWYRRHAGSHPNDWMKRPEIEMQILGGRLNFCRYLPSKEVESHAPFRDENIREPVIKTPFADDGADIPKFLRKPIGGNGNDTEGRHASEGS